MPDNENPGAVPPLNPVPPPQPPAYDQSQSRTWNMWCHLSAISGLVVPFGQVIGPLLVWQIKKNEFPSVVAHGKAALNFQLTAVIAILATLIAGFILSFFCVGFLLFFLIPIFALCSIIFAIIAGLKANDGLDYKYPWSLNLIK